MMMTVHSPDVIDVVLADDSEHFRRGMEAVLSTDDRLQVVGVARDGEELLDLVGRLAPDVAVVDLRMPRLDGVAATRAIRATSPVTRVLMLTVSDEDDDLLAAIVAGAHGYLLKETAIEDIPDAILEVTGGGAPLSPPMAAALWHEYSELLHAGRTPPVLLARQEQALQLLSQGVAADQIAAGLGVSRMVVEHDLFDAFEKVRLVGGLRELHV
jgi:DNA-binding NarL/FixJ family response regulator